MVTIEIARHARVPMSDAAVREIVSAVVRRQRQKFSPLPFGRGSEGGRGLSVAFVGSQEMRRLNRTYHGEDRVTDVLAFGTEERRTQERRTRSIRKYSVLQFFSSPSELGELVVCPDRVKRQAEQSGEPFRRELTRVLVHGTLHLLGYDHATPREAERMFGMQERLVCRIT